MIQQISRTLSEENRIISNDGYFKSAKYRRYLQDKADYYNSLPGVLQHYDCDICHNKGVIEYIDDNLNETCKTCECMKIRACYEAMAKSGITSDMVKRFRFDQYKESVHEWQTKMKHTAMRYAQSDLSEWLLLAGQSGTGKTHLCTAVCSYLLGKGHEVKYVLWHDVARKLNSLKFKNDEFDAYIKTIHDAEILYIDDLFKTDKSAGVAFEILNQRYMSRKPTIISTEATIDIMMQIDEAVASRVSEMTKNYNCQLKRDTGRNYRLW